MLYCCRRQQNLKVFSEQHLQRYSNTLVFQELSLFIIMRVHKKTKTLIERDIFLTLLAKNKRHLSINSEPQLAQAKTAASQLIQILVDTVQSIQKKKEVYYNSLQTLWNQLQMAGSSYFQLMQPQNTEILSVPDEQPQPESKKNKGIINLEVLKKTSRKKASQLDRLGGRQSLLLSMCEGDKKDRDQLVQKLKQEYQAIKHANYEAGGQPVEDSRVQFKDKEAEVFDIFRNSEGNQGIHKKLNQLIIKKGVKCQNEKEKQQKTLQQKLKDSINKITSNKTAFNSEAQTQRETYPKQGLANNFDAGCLLGGEEFVMARESNFKETVYTVMPTKETINRLGLKVEKEQSRLPSIKGNQRQQLSQRIDSSFNKISKLRKLNQLSVKKEIRLKNSRSSCALLKIYKL